MNARYLVSGYGHGNAKTRDIRGFLTEREALAYVADRLRRAALSE
jgi:hypothetical protein